MFSSINFRRGFFRIWIAFSAIWIICVGLINYGWITRVPDLPDRAYVLTEPNGKFHELTKDSGERILPGELSSLSDADLLAALKKTDPAFFAAHFWKAEFPNHVSLFLSNAVTKAAANSRGEEFADKFAKRADEVFNARLAALETTTVVAISAPLILLLTGLLLIWIVRGFSSRLPVSEKPLR